ncbi:alpha/beta fold hydrolase [Streptomyces sp. Tue6028]|uniref:alpha/beta fold hydrolase n=1 Tax=Streptomyces sp. Tue6028 TaxID=2036037 RepID=UPI003D746D0B
MSSAIVFGANGFIGRPLVAELLNRGRQVAATVRGSGGALTSWLAEQGVDIRGLTIVRADITEHGLGLAPDALPDVRDVYNAAGRYAFGITAAEAQATNVAGALHVVEWAATRPDLRRLVHISGYRVSGEDSPPPDYRKLGAYEASKIEGDTAVRARARELGVPLTLANPSSVIGPGQYIGLATMIADLWRGKLPALPGSRDVFLPVVTLDHLVHFLASIPEHSETAGNGYWILDDTTPNLPELVSLVAEHLGVRAPSRTVPVGLIRQLPRSLTGADPETLSFLSADRYPTKSANVFAEITGVPVPAVDDALREWADHLVATRFGAAELPSRVSGFHSIAGSQTWVVGELQSPEYVLLHGLLVDADSWTGVADRLGVPVLAADLPGLGRSAPAVAGPDAWLTDLMNPVTTRPVLVAHSLAAGPALRFAKKHPERISGLALVAPAFLQKPSSLLVRSPLAVASLRRITADRLARTMGLPLPPGEAVASTVDSLGRPGAAARAIKALRAHHAEHGELRQFLGDVQVPVQLIVGSADPLDVTTELPVVTVKDAGHYPQLAAPDAVAEAIENFSARIQQPIQGGGRHRAESPADLEATSAPE